MTSGRDTQTLGSYAGLSGEERQERRREQLLESGLELFGTAGYANASVKAICAEAGLTERYFYESFSDREDMLFGVYEQVARQVTALAVAAADAAEATIEARARAGMQAFFGLLTGAIRKARVLSFEVVGGSERLERR